VNAKGDRKNVVSENSKGEEEGSEERPGGESYHVGTVQSITFRIARNLQNQASYKKTET